MANDETTATRSGTSAVPARRRAPRWPVPLALLAWAAACAPAEPPDPDFLLLSIDTLRADHLGSYGYERETSPNLDLFAQGAIRYENAYAPAPWTLPSHVALLTGRHPYEVGIVDLESAIPGAVSPLAARLAAAGYQTAAYVDSAPGGLLGAGRGFARGFDVYEHAPHPTAGAWRYDVAATVDAGLTWLAARDPGRPFLLFLHTKSVHTTPADPVLLAQSDAPYDKPLPYRTLFLPEHRLRFDWSRGAFAGVNYLRDANERIARGELEADEFPAQKIEELIGLYDGGIYYVDHHFKRLLAGLEKLGLSDDTVVIVTADHGESFRDHRFLLHKEVYSGLLHVPLIVRDPREPGGVVVRERVSLVDVAPTLLSLAGLPLPEGSTGRVLPVADSDAPDARPLFSYYEFRRRHDYRAASLHDGPWKLVRHKLARWPEYRTELYDTRSDPGEQRPLEGEPERKREMLARLQQWTRSARGSGATISIDAQSTEQLRALGYVK